MKAIDELTTGERRALRLYIQQKYRSPMEAWRVKDVTKAGRIYLIGYVAGETIATFTDRFFLTRVNLNLRRSN